MTGYSQCRTICIGRTAFAAIKDWKRLKRLNLHGTKAGDTALEHIAGLTLLESLDVGSTLMTDVGLERLTGLTNLRALTMGGNELGDAGMQALRQMPNLTYLDLSGWVATRTSGASPCPTPACKPFSLSRTCANCASLACRRRWESKARSWAK